MSQILEPKTSTPPDSEPKCAEPIAASPEWVRRIGCWNAWQASFVLAFCLFFLFNNYLRLFYSDIWGHIAYGNWILDHGKLPTEEPFAPLAEGMPMMCTAWLSQVVLGIVGRWGGPEAYSTLFAVTITLTYLIFARTCYLQTSRIGLSAFTAMLAWGINWGRHAVIRPEMFGGLCFAVLLWLVVRSDSNRTSPSNESDTTEQSHLSFSQRLGLWIGIPVLFVLWANFHGSFVVGFAVLGSLTVGRAVEVFWRQRRIFSILGDSIFRRWLIITELALLATLLNPYGFDLVLHTLLFPSNPNLRDITEWFSLEMVSVEGITVGTSWLILLVVFRHSRLRIVPSDVLLLAIFSLAVCLRVRMVAWYGPIWMVVIAPHMANVFDQIRETQFGIRLRQGVIWAAHSSSRVFLFSLLGIWLTFAFSPTSTFVLGGKPRSAEMLYHGDTPRGVSEYLRQNPPQGLIFNPQWWGDWLVWDGPENLQVMMTTNCVHVVPPRVWKDYLAISAAFGGMSTRLSKYRINTMVVQKDLQADLYRTIRQNLGWKIVYEDELAIVAVRRASLSEAEPDEVRIGDEEDSDNTLEVDSDT